MPRRRSHWVLTLFILAVFGTAVGVPLFHLIKSLPSSKNLNLGQRANLSSGDDNGIVGITVEKVIFPKQLAQGFFTPDPGTHYAVAQIRECGGANYTSDNGGAGLDWVDWALDGHGHNQTPDPINQRNPGIDSFGGKDLTNKCVTAWLTFQFPLKVNPVWIKYTGQEGSTFGWYLVKPKPKPKPKG
jgi:hypothetical protein